jgi:hypothetical protein
MALFATLCLLANAPAAGAQTAGTATLTGHVIWCRELAGPVAAADENGSPDLSDVTPGFRKGLPPAFHVAAQDVQLTIAGTSISARTDAGGSFTLTGVPVAQPVTLVAQAAAGPSLVLGGPSLTLNPGQTLDLGTIGPPDCTGNNDAFTLQPTAPITGAPASDPGEPQSDVTMTLPADAP